MGSSKMNTSRDITISLDHLTQMSPSDQSGIFELRKNVFSDRLGWAVQCVDGLERDEFDSLPENVYVYGKANDEVLACVRLMPTTGKYMLRDVFPELLGGQPAPCSADIWELSRLAIATNKAMTNTASFGPVAKSLLVEMAHFAKEHRISQYIAVTTYAVERLFRSQGVTLQRLGRPLQMGVVVAVACVVHMDQNTYRVVGVEPPPMH
jgi:acyl homoserine lactone synthase